MIVFKYASVNLKSLSCSCRFVTPKLIWIRRLYSQLVIVRYYLWKKLKLYIKKSLKQTRFYGHQLEIFQSELVFLKLTVDGQGGFPRFAMLSCCIHLALIELKLRILLCWGRKYDIHVYNLGINLCLTFVHWEVSSLTLYALLSLRIYMNCHFKQSFDDTFRPFGSKFSLFRISGLAKYEFTSFLMLLCPPLMFQQQDPRSLSLQYHHQHFISLIGFSFFKKIKQLHFRATLRDHNIDQHLKFLNLNIDLNNKLVIQMTINTKRNLQSFS